MTDCNLETSVVDWIIDHPVTMPLFQKLAIDCSCGGKSLEYSCHQRGLDPQTVLAKLTSLIQVDREDRRAAQSS